MQISDHRAGDLLVITLIGRLDSATAPLLAPKFDAHIQSGEAAFVVDCSELHYISSAGLRIFLLASRQLDPRGGRIVLAAPRRHVLEVIQLGGFSAILPHFQDLESAIASLTDIG